MRKVRLLEFARRPDSVNLAIGTVIGLAVCAPLLGGRRVFLLDWSIGPHIALATPTFLGLNGGLTSGVVASEFVTLLNDAVGGVSTWILLLLFFPTAMAGAGRLVGGSIWTRISAGVFYAVNPFVFNRIFVGHIPLLIGYALLPFATKAIIGSVSLKTYEWAIPALWWAGLTALSPHFAWIFGLVLFGVALVTFLKKEEPFGRVACWLATSVALFVLMSSYILLPHSATNLPSHIGRISLALYRTTGDAHFGLFANVLGLYGFWRLGPGPILSKDIISGWPFLLLAIFIIVGTGTWFILRKVSERSNSRDERAVLKFRDEIVLRDEVPSRLDRIHMPIHDDSDRRRLAYLLLILGFCGFFLALGDQGPTGWIFLWAYDHVPFFAIMREPEKFLMLLALAYAIFFGWGINFIMRQRFAQSTFANFAVFAILGVMLPLGYSANIFNGLNGQIAPSTIPTSYQRADADMGKGEGAILYLPWHLYMSYPFTNNRVIANIGATEFRRSVISGDNVEAGGVESQSTSPRSAYLEQLFLDGSKFQEFGALVAPLGVKYIVLAKTVDWQNYAWLGRQRDLTRIFNTSSLEVWRNSAYAGVGWGASRLQSVTSLSELVKLSQVNAVAGRVFVTKGEGGRSPSNVTSYSEAEKGWTSRTLLRSVKELSPVAFEINAGESGWVTVDAPYQRGWYFDGREAIESAEGTLLIHVGNRRGILEFTPWRLVRLGYLISIVSFAILLMTTYFGRKFVARNGDVANIASHNKNI